MGTDIQEVYDAFQIKIPNFDYTGREDMIYMYFKIAIAKSYKTTSDDLSYEYDEVNHRGRFNSEIGYDTIELLSMFMVQAYYQRKYTYLIGEKQHIGTRDFNKLPDKAKELSSVVSALANWDSKIYEFRQEFYNYSDED